MAYEKKMVYVLTAWFKDDSYSSPSEEFYAESWDEAERKKKELLQDPEYEDVWISDDMEERELWKTTLDDRIKRAERIRDDKNLNADQKAKKLAEMMTDMEGEYQIPMIRNPEWEAKNPDVIKTYRQISDMREL